MVFAALLGVPLGSVAGLAIGTFALKSLGKPSAKDWHPLLDISGDADAELDPALRAVPVPDAKKALIGDLSPWLVDPSFHRVLFINSILTILWPQLGPAIHKEVIKQAKQPLEDIKAKVKVLEGVRIDELDLGSRPFRLDSIRLLTTQEDELILEAPLFWGGDITVRVTASIKLGPVVLDIPLRVCNVQLKALARLTIKPLVETLPCVGGITLSMMEVPHVDCELHLGPSPDLMALPGVPEAVKLAIKMVVGKMLGYPNELAVPIMPNFGAPPAPLGMLHVKVVNAVGLKSSMLDTVDPLVRMEIREGRTKATSVMDNNPNPVWNEEFDFIVDDPAKQRLNIVVEDFDFLSNDTVGVTVVQLADADFIQRPRRAVALSLPLQPPKKGKKGDEKDKQEEEASGGVAPATTAAGAATGVVAEAEAAVEAEPPSPASVATSTHELSPRGSSSEKHGSFLGGIFKKKKKSKHGDAVTPPASPGAAAAAGERPPSGRGSRLGGLLGGLPHSKNSKKRTAGEFGTLNVELTFFPFKEVEAQPDPTEQGQQAQDAATRHIMLRRLNTMYSNKGVLNVSVKKCVGLGEGINTYVTLILDDPVTGTQHKFSCPTVLGESNPRYEFKADFVNVGTKSVLLAEVYSIETGGVTKSLKNLVSGGKKPQRVGWVRVGVEEVVKEGRITDLWALQEAEAGELHMALEWKTLEFSENALDD